MDSSLTLEFSKVPRNSCAATKRVMELLVDGICPALLRLRSKLRSMSVHENEDEVPKIKNVYLLCTSQIKKCMVNFLDILKMENKQQVHLQESRKFIFERLSWCITKLLEVENNLDKCKQENGRQELNLDPIFSTPMYFVNWIDYTFEILGKLSEDVYRTDYKNDDSLYEEWKERMVEHVTSLHPCIDELLLSAMTLCKYCLPEDQTILRARCQVVLRETKALFSELINEDISTAVKVTKEKLKLPIMPSNVNMVIDVLRDVLYVLETNTNTALLALLIHCYVNCASPVDVLQDHFSKRKQKFCPCSFTNSDIEECNIVKDFDLFNERLQQIGSFAVSCSSDQKRILTLRSCLSSLESLDPHLVPSITTSPNGDHTKLLANFWKQEVMEIRDTVFLIVDPIAFVEKCKQYMRDLLLEMKKEERNTNRDLWVVISIGSLVYDFFDVYKKYEPEAIAHYDELDGELKNLHRAQKECKYVSEHLTVRGTFLYDTIMKFSYNEITLETLLSRIRLLYSMVKRVHDLIRPKDSDEQLFGEEEVANNRNVTHTIRNDVNTDTYNCERKAESNFTRSVFARSGVKTSTKTVFLSKLTKHLKLKKGVQEELSFSAQVSELFNEQKQEKRRPLSPPPAMLDGKYSLRKMLLSTQRDFPFMRKLDKTFYEEFHGNGCEKKDHQEFVFNGSESLQISEILHQINDLTTIVSSNDETQDEEFSTKPNKTFGNERSVQGMVENIASTSNMTNTTQPSNFTTLERINDLDLVESKLNSLRANSEFETHL